jgi:iron-sulfur cluster repair protein YtfE (RIC family)
MTPGERMVEDLRWVHAMLRDDLATLRRLAADIIAGRSADHVTSAIRSLQTQGPLWQLRVNCLRYCQLVHHHHGAEDAMLFPALRKSNPALGPAVDRLERDHRRVSDLLDHVEALATQLKQNDDNAGVRHALATALTDLSDHLLEHLAFEEESIIPTMRSWTRGLW